MNDSERSRSLGWLFLLLVLPPLVMTAISKQARAEGETEYNFSWLDPEKKIYVLQNRRYLKAGHLLVSGLVGTSFSNAYRSAWTANPKLGFYFTEGLGIEAMASFTFNVPNSNMRALELASSAAIPQIREIRSQFGGQLHWVPWYAKINVFNKVLYFDWYFAAGAGLMQTFVDTRTNASAAANYVEQDVLSLIASTGHWFHVNDWFLVRLDFTGSFYNAPVTGVSGETAWYSSYGVSLGLGLKI